MGLEAGVNLLKKQLQTRQGNDCLSHLRQGAYIFSKIKNSFPHKSMQTTIKDKYIQDGDHVAQFQSFFNLEFVQKGFKI